MLLVNWDKFIVIFGLYKLFLHSRLALRWNSHLFFFKKLNHQNYIPVRQEKSTEVKLITWDWVLREWSLSSSGMGPSWACWGRGASGSGSLRLGLTGRLGAMDSNWARTSSAIRSCWSGSGTSSLRLGLLTVGGRWSTILNPRLWSFHRLGFSSSSLLCVPRSPAQLRRTLVNRETPVVELVLWVGERENENQGREKPGAAKVDPSGPKPSRFAA